MTTKTKRLSAEAIRQREDDARRFLNQWRIWRVADAAVTGYCMHAVPPPVHLCDGSADQYEAMRDMQPDWNGQ